MRQYTAYGSYVLQTLDNPGDGGAMLKLESSTDDELTAAADGEVQYGIYLDAKLNQDAGHSVAFNLIYADVTDTQSGTAQDYTLNLNWDGNPMFQILDNGDGFLTGTLKTEVVTADAPAEPHACDATHAGVIVAVDDTNDTAYNQPCICLNLDGTGYDWRQLSDVVGTACPTF